MAAPAVHVLRGLAWLEASGASFEAAAFARGSVFPDIRYLGVVRRDQTHDRPYTAAEVLAAPTAFEAGRRHHNLLDAAWNQYYHAFDWGVPPAGYYGFAVALKSVEAMVLLGAVADRKRLTDLLEAIDDEAVEKWGLAPADVARWQGLVRADLKVAADLDAQLAFLERLEFDPALAVTVRRHARVIAADPTWRQRVTAFVLTD